jgi:hypothetical protein
MRLRLLAAPLVLVLLVGSLFAADPGLLSLAPPDSNAMAGINTEQVLLSPLGQYFSRQQPDPGMQKLIDTTGFDPRRDVREILAATSGQPRNSGIVLVRGTFDVPRIVEAATANGGTVETYKGVQIIQDKSIVNQGSVAFPDSTIAILGSPADVRAAIDRKSAPTSVSSALAVAVNQASTTEDIWFVTIVPPLQLQPQPAGANAQAPNPFAVLEKVVSASGGVKFGANLVLTVQAVSQTAQDASTLETVVKSFISMVQTAQASTKDPVRKTDWMRSISISSDGSATNLSVSIPEQRIEEMMQPTGPAGGSTGYDVQRLAPQPGHSPRK